MSLSPTKCSDPDRHLSCCDALLTVLGIVIGSGVFVTPALVAANTATVPRMILAWALGAFLCLCGALSYAELGAALSHAGGEYVYLSTAFGRTVGFFFIWARVTVIQTGAIAVILILLPAAGGRLRELLGLGFETAIEYTAPAFWIFMLLTSIAPVLLRWRNPTLKRPFRIPLYPFPSILLAGMSTYMLYCSLAYTRLGALVGVGVLIAGIPIYWYSDCTWQQQSRADIQATVAPPGSGHS